VWFRQGWRAVLILVMALGVYLSLLQVHPNSKLVECSVDTLTRFVTALLTGFSVGALAAYRLSYRRVQAWLKSPVAAVIGSGLLLIHLGWLKGSYSWQESVLLAPVFFMVVAGNTFGGILSSRPMRCLGQISYSVYILHGLILFTLTSLWNRRYPIAGMTIIEYWCGILGISLVVVFVCTLSYWWIERPFFWKAPVSRDKEHSAVLIR
jgi:peptidoglycan/LPS O-acetylase OafA/YrhL